MTLSGEKRFRPRNTEIKKMSYNIIMYNPRLAKDSVKVVKEKFAKADAKGKKNIIDAIRMAAAISMNNAKDSKKFKRAEREKIFEIGVMYKTLARDLDNELREFLEGKK